ncbi:hypothetical protein FGO68_gene8197 [Halteria grandinella]|uniref:GOLD domain-containing protein n=1 Tax=Halteria grandinella TaxID=5974 RepID=A0A8J8NCQ7_HALGN|nr:hypothetical protein FGO68_gene8197 [Halteria grandinella]
MLSMDLPAKSDEVFLQDVAEGEKLQFRGAYFTGNTQNSDKAQIDFFILNPDRKVIFNRRKQAEGIFSINATKPGQYSFIFSNLKSRMDKQLTIAFQVSNMEAASEPVVEDNTGLEGQGNQALGDDYLRDEEVHQLMRTFQQLQVELVSMQSEQRIALVRQDMHNGHVDLNNRYSWWTALIEGALFAGFAGFQVWYIMNMLENKRLLL